VRIGGCSKLCGTGAKNLAISIKLNMHLKADYRFKVHDLSLFLFFYGGKLNSSCLYGRLMLTWPNKGSKKKWTSEGILA
jgi:hypothetical protein